MSIVEVAKRVGVSHATVSRVINGRPGVAPATVARVRSAMAELGYEPAAPHRRRGPRPRQRRGIRTGNVGMIIFNVAQRILAQQPLLNHVLQAVQDCLVREGLNMILGHVHETDALPPAILKGEVDGLILEGHVPPQPLYDRLNHYPAVWVLTAPTEFWGDQVEPDNVRIGQLAAEYLQGRGCTTFGFLDVQPHHPAYGIRREAFCRTAARYGEEQVRRLGPDPDSVPEWYEDIDALEQRVLASLTGFARDPARPEGLFVPSDILTPMVYKALQLQGVRPEQDVAIISCNNERRSLVGLHPRPATIDIDVDTIARRAVQQLLWRIQNPAEENRMRLLIKPGLVAGDEELGTD